MKKIFVFALIAIMGTACSHIDEDERLIYVKPADVARAVLIEDFTGQRCINCPAATDVIHQLQEAYGDDKIIAVAIHSGPFAHRSTLTSPFISDLGTEQGDDYFNHWNIEGQPGVKINRGAPIYDPSQYAAAVSKEMQKNAPVAIENIYGQSNGVNQMTFNIVLGMATADIIGKLQVWIVEDGINSEGGNRLYTQFFPNNVTDVNYVHNHVFRASITNDPYGDPVSLKLGQQLPAISYQAKLAEGWKKENLSLVVFIWNEAEGVLQVARRAFKDFDEPTPL